MKKLESLYDLFIFIGYHLQRASTALEMGREPGTKGCGSNALAIKPTAQVFNSFSETNISWRGTLLYLGSWYCMINPLKSY